VLANVDGECERCGAEVTRRELMQRYFKTTAYAQEFHERLDDLQETWIGKGCQCPAQLGRSLRGRQSKFRADAGRWRVADAHGFTTRPDTLPGATFMVVEAEVVAPWRKQALEVYLAEVRKASDIDRLATNRPKTGVDLGITATNPMTGRQIPVWAADYVLADYGNGTVCCRAASWSRSPDDGVIASSLRG
jgi:leucyl-tRNA synthetase